MPSTVERAVVTDASPNMAGQWVPSLGRWESAGMGTPTECWTLSTSDCPSAGAEYSSLPDSLEAPGSLHLRKYFLSQKAAAGILRRAARRGRRLPGEMLAALESVANGGGAVPVGDSEVGQGDRWPCG